MRSPSTNSSVDGGRIEAIENGRRGVGLGDLRGVRFGSVSRRHKLSDLRRSEGSAVMPASPSSGYRPGEHEVPEPPKWRIRDLVVGLTDLESSEHPCGRPGRRRQWVTDQIGDTGLDQYPVVRTRHQ
jgi:hypothetical protein